MREIKFRIWMGNAFYYWGFLRDETNLYFQGIPSQNEPMSYKLEHSQQFTGLLDRNSKEIYEGDIAVFDRDGKDYWRELYEIKYSPYRACWQLFLWKRANHVDSPQYISNAFTQGEADTISIIGNIYEHSYLLDTKTEKGEAI